jgi:hypothetical protein
MNISGSDIKVEGRFVRIGQLAGDKYEFLDDPKTVLDGLRSCGSRVDLFTFMQKLPYVAPPLPYPFVWDNLAALPVSTYEHWLKQQIDFKVRNKVRKAEKSGLSIREVPFDDALVRGISQIYNESPVRQGKPFWHYQKDLESVRAMNETFLERSIFIGVFQESNLIGFAKLVADRDGGQAGLMQIVSMIQHRDKAPTNALIAQAVRSCADRGIRHLVYSNFSYGNKQHDSLSDFKLHNGFVQVDLPRYYVPLTALGRAAFRLKLHQRLTEHVPEPIAAPLRKIRGFWYSLKLQKAN